MSEKPSDHEEKNQALFLHLVMMLSASAMQQMGKTVNPATGKTEISLDGAAFAIDMLSMLDARTTGNLTPDESRMLQSQLSSLRLNFFETSEQQKHNPVNASNAGSDGGSEKPDDPSASPDNTSSRTPDTTEPASSPPSGKDDNTPRYHKSYG